MPVNNEDAHLKTQNLGEKYVTFEAPFNCLPCFNILETWRRRKFMINIRIGNFFIIIIKRFLNNRETCKRGPNYIIVN